MTLPAPAPSSPTSKPTTAPSAERQQRTFIIVVSVVAVILIVGLIAGAVFLVYNPATAANVRDIMIIFMALEFVVIGAALVVLMFQLAVLTNMLQHEIKPILDSTNETMNTIRGTTSFLSDNLVEPVVKLNTYLAAITQVVDSLGTLGRFGRRKN